MPNPSYSPGPFSLEISGGISAYVDPRPQLLLVSSAGVERNAKVGDDPVKRQAEIPIVQLNPGGTLNHKYAGECAVRASGLRYSVVRPTGMVDTMPAEAPAVCRLEADQGDVISGRLTRDEVADVVVAALGSPEAVDKTFEVRRSEAADAAGKAMKQADFLRMFLRLSLGESQAASRPTVRR